MIYFNCISINRCFCGTEGYSNYKQFQRACNMQDYVQNKIAHMWIKEIRRQRNVNKILKVQYNNIDITKKALELDTYKY